MNEKQLMQVCYKEGYTQTYHVDSDSIETIIDTIVKGSKFILIETKNEGNEMYLVNANEVRSILFQTDDTSNENEYIDDDLPF